MDNNGCKALYDKRWLYDDLRHIQMMNTVVVCTGFYPSCYDGYKVAQ